MPKLPFDRPAADQSFETVMEVLANSDLSKDDKAFVLASAWTLDQVPKIRNAVEYQRYNALLRNLQAELDAELPPRNDPQWEAKWSAQTRSPQHIMHTAISSRMIEW
jgi:hypothetical protein